MAYLSSPELLTLHALRIEGFANPGGVCQRFSLDRDTVQELLLDYEGYGWVQRVGFTDIGGWSLNSCRQGAGQPTSCRRTGRGRRRDVIAER